MNNTPIDEASQRASAPRPNPPGPSSRYPVPGTRFSVPLWRALSALAGFALLIAGTLWSGLGGLLLIMAALIPMGAAAADISLLAGVRDLLHHSGKISS